MKHNYYRLSSLFIVLIAVALLIVFPVVVAAEANVSKSYISESTIEPGSIVSFSDTRNTRVGMAASGERVVLVGVAVPIETSLVEINPNELRTQVAQAGDASVFVSTINGAIEKGDLISVSPIRGVGMKSDPGAPVVGVALAAMNGQERGSIVRTVTDIDGKKRAVTVNKIPMTIAVGYAPQADSEEVSPFLEAAKDAATAITGKPVSTFRVVVAMIVALIGFVSLIVLIYGASRGSLIAIGRNPLASQSVYWSLLQVMGIAVALMAVIMGVIYLVLR